MGGEGDGGGDGGTHFCELASHIHFVIFVSKLMNVVKISVMAKALSPSPAAHKGQARFWRRPVSTSASASAFGDESTNTADTHCCLVRVRRALHCRSSACSMCTRHHEFAPSGIGKSGWSSLSRPFARCSLYHDFMFVEVLRASGKGPVRF